MEKIEFEKINCTVCGSEKTELIENKGYLGYKIFVSICPNCGLVYLNPRWTKQKYNDFYSNFYSKVFKPNHSTKTDKEIEKVRYQNVKIIIERVKQYLPHDFNSLLDIGAGNGSYLEYFKSIFPNISLFAIESSKTFIKLLKDSVKATLISNDFDSIWHTQTDQTFDFIIFRQTLEHSLDPISILKKIQNKLSKTGMAYISVPNMMSPKMQGPLDNYWYRVVHTYYFSESTFLSLTAKAGLRPLIIDSSTHELWGIFQRGNTDYQLNNVYIQQKEAIKKFKKEYFKKQIFSFPILMLKSFIPAKAKVWVKKIIEKRVSI